MLGCQAVCAGGGDCGLGPEGTAYEVGRILLEKGTAPVFVEGVGARIEEEDARS